MNTDSMVQLKPGEYQIGEVRTSQQVAAEIITIREQTSGALQAIAVNGAVKIGKRLKEAKALVPYGEWCAWLTDNLDYSERTAQNLMRLAEESEKAGFAPLLEMSYTQAVQMIGLPAGEREAFMEENDVSAMSTRDLKAAIQKYEKKIEGMQLTIDGLKADRKDGVTASDAEALKRQAEKAEEDAKAANKKAKEKEKQIERLTKELKKAQQVQLGDAKVIAEAKAEIPQAVKQELEELREKERQRKATENETAAAMKREGAEYTFRALYDQMKNNYEGLATALRALGPEKKAKYSDAMIKALETMKTRTAEIAAEG